MITSPYFQNYVQDTEQQLMDDLIVESIQIAGHDVYYVTRTLNNYDPIRGEDDQSTYANAYFIEMYLDNFMAFQGDQELVSKFAGAEIRDQVIFSVSRRRFTEETEMFRPREGDLIFFSLNKKCFQIQFVSQYEMFYPLGKIYTWKMTCELFEYSNEIFNTGIPEIDKIQLASTNILDYTIRDTDGIPLLTVEGDYLVTDAYHSDNEPISDNKDITNETESNNYVDWNQTDPFSDWTNANTHTI